MALGRKRTPNATSSSASVVREAVPARNDLQPRERARRRPARRRQQHVAPDHPDEKECFRAARRTASPDRATHTARGRERPGRSPQYNVAISRNMPARRAPSGRSATRRAHRRRSPIAEAPVLTDRVDVGGVDRDVGGWNTRMSAAAGERADGHDHAERCAALFGRGAARGRPATAVRWLSVTMVQPASPGLSRLPV